MIEKMMRQIISLRNLKDNLYGINIILYHDHKVRLAFETQCEEYKTSKLFVMKEQERISRIRIY